MDSRSPAQVYALVFGAVLVIGGIVGFFYDASFDIGESATADEAVGLLAVNGWHNVVHLLSGLIGLALAGSYGGARAYALVLGVVYSALAAIGFLLVDTPGFLLDFVPLNTEDNVFHLLIGIAGLGAGLATDAEPGPTAAVT